jgi:hypothetical protein
VIGGQHIASAVKKLFDQSVQDALKNTDPPVTKPKLLGVRPVPKGCG